MTGPTQPLGPEITTGSVLTLHPLAIRPEWYAGQRRWIVGRVDTGDFVAFPQLGRDAVELLAAGIPVGAVAHRLTAGSGQPVDAVAFARSLVELGFVATVGGAPAPGPEPMRSTLAWLTPRMVGWVLAPATGLAVLVVILAGCLAAVLQPQALPGYRSVVWSPQLAVVLVVNTAIAWALILLHELAHLVTARAAGVPGRLSLSTRLQFLTAQTDVSGVWAAPRRVRAAVYCAGILLDLAVAALALSALAWLGPTGTVRDLLATLFLFALLCVVPQTMVFVRTDLYFVLQDLSGCPNLYAMGSEYLRLLASRCRHRLTGHPVGTDRPSPADRYPVVRWYAAVLLVGTVTCLACYAAVTLPVLALLVSSALALLARPDSGWDVANGAGVLVILGFFQALWVRAWVRRHGPRLRGWWRSTVAGKRT